MIVTFCSRDENSPSGHVKRNTKEPFFSSFTSEMVWAHRFEGQAFADGQSQAKKSSSIT
jgi:hypothetical protein